MIEGRRPRIVPACAGALLAVASAALVAACATGSADQVTSPTDLGMASSLAPYVMSGDTTIYQTVIPVPLPVRQPTGDEEAKLGPMPKGTAYPHAPYLLASDEQIEIHFVISNVDAVSHAVWLLIDPWNEFVRWRPGLTVSEENVQPNFGYDQAFLVAGNSRVQGTITTDDMQEIAVKLASVETMLASPQTMQAEAIDTMLAEGQDVTQDAFDPSAVANNIFNIQNRSNSGDLLYTPWIPPVIAGLTGFDLGLRSYEATAPNVAVEITMDITDTNGDRFLAPGQSGAEIGVPPATLSPPSANLF